MSNLDVGAIMAGLTAPAETRRGLPNACYRDPEAHLLEAHSLFARTWTCIGVGADIPEPGDVLPVELAGMPLVLVRDRTGAINGFHNVCSHRGVLLVTGPERHRSSLRCPYHSWTYGLDGRLVRTPHAGGWNLDSCPALEKSDLGLAPVRLEVWNDLIFADLSGTAEPLSTFLGPLDERWSGYEMSRLRHAASWELELAANWKLAIENYLESYHLPWIHPNLTSRSPLENHHQVVVCDRVYGQVTSEFSALSSGEAPFTPFPDLTPEQQRSGEYPLVFPNLLLGLQPDHFYAIIIDPLAPDRTRERIHLYLVGDRPDREDHDLAVEQLVDTWKRVFAEDVGVVELMQSGRRSDAFAGGILTEAHDRLTHRFMVAVARALASGARTAGMAANR